MQQQQEPLSSDESLEDSDRDSSGSSLDGFVIASSSRPKNTARDEPQCVADGAIVDGFVIAELSRSVAPQEDMQIEEANDDAATAWRVLEQLDAGTAEVVNRWPSQRVAASSTGLAQTAISLVCNGKARTAGGFRFAWRYSSSPREAEGGGTTDDDGMPPPLSDRPNMSDIVWAEHAVAAARVGAPLPRDWRVRPSGVSYRQSRGRWECRDRDHGKCSTFISALEVCCGAMPWSGGVS
jgi:hypothetical protein